MKFKQTMMNVKAGGKAEQRANLQVDQVMRDVDAAGDVRQLVEAAGTNLETIASELAELHSEMQRYDSGAVSELERLKNAEAAARDGDSDRVVASLKGTARWVVDFATKVGTSVVAKLIEKQMGF